MTTANTAPDAALDLAFRAARSFNRFTDRAVSSETLARLYELSKWGPTSMNSQPARFVFVQSAEAKERLKPCLAPGNVDKTMSAPVTVIVAFDTRFFENLPTQCPARATCSPAMPRWPMQPPSATAACRAPT